MKKNIIIICSILIGVIIELTIITVFLITNHISMVSFEKNNRSSSIEKLLLNHSKSNDIIYIEDTYAYFNNITFDTKYNIVWIDEDNIIYTKDGKTYTLASSNGEELLLNSNNEIKIDNSSIIYHNSILYYSFDNKYYNYNSFENSKEINKEDYFSIKYGNKYNISRVNEEIKIHNNLKNEDKTIKIDNIINQELYDFSKYNITFYDYCVMNGNIILHFDIKNYEISVLYDYDSENIEICGWCYREYKNTNYLRSYLVNNHTLKLFSDVITKLKSN